MKIIITDLVAVAPEHGINMGRVFEVAGYADIYKDDKVISRGVYVRGDLGELVKVMQGEFKYLAS